MKKLLTLLIFAVSFAVQAQKVTEKDLQGSWKAIKIDDGYAIIEPEKGTAQLTESAKDGLTPAEIAKEEKEVRENMDDYRDAVMTFKGNKVRTTLAGEETISGSFTLNKEGNVLTIDLGDGDTQDADVQIKDNKLYVHDNTDGLNVVFEKM